MLVINIVTTIVQISLRKIIGYKLMWDVGSDSKSNTKYQVYGIDFN